MKILAVDDEPVISMMVRKLLVKRGFRHVLCETHADKAFELIKAQLPDLVLLDIRMPAVSGLDILHKIREDRETVHIPVIILTSDTETEVKVEALSAGANDVLHKPINEPELLARVMNTLLAKVHVDHLATYSHRMERAVRLRTSELLASRREAIHCLARATEMRDDTTGRHIFRVGRYAAIIAAEIGLNQEQVTAIEHAAQLHDVGKIGIPDSILKKPGKLDADEYEKMKQHCVLGAQVIRESAYANEKREWNTDHADPDSQWLADSMSPIMKMAANVAASHHERWDGTGYPNGLKQNDIPIEGRITAIADVFDALSTKRCYKEAFKLEECFRQIHESSGAHFDPELVAAFERRRVDILDVFHSFADEPPKP